MRIEMVRFCIGDLCKEKPVEERLYGCVIDRDKKKCTECTEQNECTMKKASVPITSGICDRCFDYHDNKRRERKK